MKERGLLLTDIMALRAWEGYKTQTRHPVKGKALEIINETHALKSFLGPTVFRKRLDDVIMCCPWGIPGDRIYVREAMAILGKIQQIIYRSNIDGYPYIEKKIKWTPNIHMFKKHARTWADVTYTGIQHVQDITDEDCIAEGIMSRVHQLGMMEYGGVRQNKDGSFVWLGSPRDAFRDLWNSIYGDWDKNPVVWVNHFKKI